MLIAGEFNKSGINPMARQALHHFSRLARLVEASGNREHFAQCLFHFESACRIGIGGEVAAIVVELLRRRAGFESADCNQGAHSLALGMRFEPLRLAQDGVSAIVVDRLGYDDNGVAVLAALEATGRTALLAQADRYVAFLVRK